MLKLFEDFAGALRCTYTLFRKLSKALWESEGHDYAQVVLASIKDNPAFSAIAEESSLSAKEKPWFFTGLWDLVASLWSSPAFGDVLAQLCALFFEELQHERFKEHRAMALVVGLQVREGPPSHCHTDLRRRASQVSIGEQQRAMTRLCRTQSQMS